MQSQSVSITHTVIPSSGIPMHPCLCSRSTNSSHFLQLPISAPPRGLQQPSGAHNWNRVHPFNSSWLVFFASGRPPCVRHRDRHGDGALRPSWSRLRHQSLLLRLHPERGQVHLPEEVRVWLLGAIYFIIIIFWPCSAVGSRWVGCFFFLVWWGWWRGWAGAKGGASHAHCRFL